MQAICKILAKYESTLGQIGGGKALILSEIVELPAVQPTDSSESLLTTVILLGVTLYILFTLSPLNVEKVHQCTFKTIKIEMTMVCYVSEPTCQKIV